MSVFRVEKSANYTVMSNQHFKERKMSLKSKGLLSLMLSLPDDWDYSISGLITLSDDGETSVKSSLKELERFGYLRVDKIYPSKGGPKYISYIYNIFEKPILQGVDSQGVGSLPLGNQGQLSTEKLNTKDKIHSPSVSAQNTSKPLLDITNKKVIAENKKSKKAKDIGDMRNMILAFTQNKEVQDELTAYFNIRVKRGLQPLQWEIILADLRAFAGTNTKLAISKVRGAIAGGYMQIIAEWEKDKKTKFAKPAFDNTAGRKVESYVDMGEEEKEQFKKNLAVDKDGNLLKF